MYATEAKHQRAVQLLLERGANPDLKPRPVKGGEAGGKKGLLSSLAGLFSKDKSASTPSTTSKPAASTASSAKPGAPLGPSKIEIIAEEAPQAAAPTAPVPAPAPVASLQSTSQNTPQRSRSGQIMLGTN